MLVLDLILFWLTDDQVMQHHTKTDHLCLNSMGKYKNVSLYHAYMHMYILSGGNKCIVVGVVGKETGQPLIAFPCM